MTISKLSFVSIESLKQILFLGFYSSDRLQDILEEHSFHYQHHVANHLKIYSQLRSPLLKLHLLEIF